ncbi:hypothetical protein MRB53_041382 [Persea americana]|nr:hypothetical protein MRB53_041382 [Persea americana]
MRVNLVSLSIASCVLAASCSDNSIRSRAASFAARWPRLISSSNSTTDASDVASCRLSQLHEQVVVVVKRPTWIDAHDQKANCSVAGRRMYRAHNDRVCRIAEASPLQAFKEGR